MQCLGELKCDGVEGQVINMPWRIKDAFTRSFVHDKNISVIFHNLMMGPLYGPFLRKWNNLCHHYIFSFFKTVLIKIIVSILIIFYCGSYS